MLKCRKLSMFHYSGEFERGCPLDGGISNLKRFLQFFHLSCIIEELDLIYPRSSFTNDILFSRILQSISSISLCAAMGVTSQSELLAQKEVPNT